MSELMVVGLLLQMYSMGYFTGRIDKTDKLVVFSFCALVSIVGCLLVIFNK